MSRFNMRIEMIYSKIRRERLSNHSVELTLRDKFALSAPICPDWFEVNASSLGPEPKEPIWDQFISRFDFSSPEEESMHPSMRPWGGGYSMMTEKEKTMDNHKKQMNRAHEDFSIVRKNYVDWVNKSNILREQQWSWFYADEMIKGR